MKANTVGWLLAILALGLAGCGEVQHHQPVGEPGELGELEVTTPWSREIPPNAPVAAGFLSIRNGGGVDERLVGVRSDASESVEIHEVRHEDGMARMRELADGLPLPAGEMVELKPGGYHLMFIGPREGRFIAGNRVAATLAFEQAGEREVVFEVRAVDAGTNAPADAQSHH